MKTKTVNTTPGKYKYVTTGGETFTFRPKGKKLKYVAASKPVTAENLRKLGKALGNYYIDLPQPTTSKEEWTERFRELFTENGYVASYANDIEAFIQSVLDEERKKWQK